MRPFAERGSNAWLMATVALGIVADNVVLFTFGKEPRGIPAGCWPPARCRSPASSVYLQLLIPVVGLAIAACCICISSRTRSYGKAMLAVVQNRDAARLMGIDVRVVIGRLRASTLLAGVAGILIAPLFNVHSDMGTLFGIKAFAVAILGGITSAWGVVLAGLIYGLTEALITALLGSTYTQIVSFALVIVRWRNAAERPVRPRRGEEGHEGAPCSSRRWRCAWVSRSRRRERLLRSFVMALVALTAIVGIGLNVLLGLTGQISFGHVGFYAIGAYTVAILTAKAGWSFWAALPAAALAAAWPARCSRYRRCACADPTSRW